MIEELRAKAEAMGVKVDGRWKESKLLQVIADAADPAQDEVDADTGPITESYDQPGSITIVGDLNRIAAMSSYALRIWEGQSPDMPKHERIERVQSGLKAQGWGDILEHLSLPNA